MNMIVNCAPHEYLHPTSQTKHQMQCRLLLNVVVRESTTILQLLPSKYQTLLIRRNALLILNLLLHVINGVRGFHIESDGLASKSLHEYLHS